MLSSSNLVESNPINTQNLDYHQLAVKQNFDILAKNINNLHNSHLIKKFFRRIIKKSTIANNNPSIYLYGGVGRGKTMLMKDFFNQLNIKQDLKKITHFGSFMFNVHQTLQRIRKNTSRNKGIGNYNLRKVDEVELAVELIIENCQILCFDEFQVVDIADAMLLGRIFKIIFSKKIIVIFTSNTHPLELYKNGLQRQLFIDFVTKVLMPNCSVINLDSGIDYRKISLNNLTSRYFIASNSNKERFAIVIKSSVDLTKIEPRVIKVWGREFVIQKTFQDIAIIDCEQIIKQQLSADDYRAICKEFSLIFLENMPRIAEEEPNEARRLILFIDEIYLAKVALVVLARTKIEKIYQFGIGFEAFKRTKSRLYEMQSDYYWQESKIYRKV